MHKTSFPISMQPSHNSRKRCRGTGETDNLYSSANFGAANHRPGSPHGSGNDVPSKKFRYASSVSSISSADSDSSTGNWADSEMMDSDVSSETKANRISHHEAPNSMEVDDLANLTNHLQLPDGRDRLNSIRHKLLQTQIALATQCQQFEHYRRDLPQDREDISVNPVQQVICKEAEADKLNGYCVIWDHFACNLLSLRIIQKAAVGAALATLKDQEKAVSTMLKEIPQFDPLAKSESKQEELQWLMSHRHFIEDPIKCADFEQHLANARENGETEAKILQNLFNDQLPADTRVKAYLQAKLKLSVQHLGRL